MMRRKKRIMIASGAALALAAALAAPSVYAKTADAAKQADQRTFSHQTMHRGAFDGTKFLEGKASVLGITADDLKERLASGKTFAEILSDLGLSKEDLKARMQEHLNAQREIRAADMRTKIAQRVADGKITQEQADRMNERLANPKEHGFGFGHGLFFRGNSGKASSPSAS